jgi:two-component system chemotaxis response regulator CheY
MKLLVVDDSAVDRHQIVSLVEKLGHEAESCQSTKGVLDKVATGNYVTVLLDVVMPEQDGYKFLRELRSNPATAKQHVIICSSKKTPVEINYGLKRAGANDYLTKPLTQESLEASLAKI